MDRDSTDGEDADRAGGVRRLMQSARKPRVMSVEVDGALFGFDVEVLREVVALRPLTKVFHAPLAIAGVANLRGDVLPVVDLRVLLGAERSVPTPESRIVVVGESGNTKLVAGVLVDRLGVLREIPESGPDPVPTTLPAVRSRLLSGVLSSPPPCCLLDVSKILATPEVGSLAGGDDAST